MQRVDFESCTAFISITCVGLLIIIIQFKIWLRRNEQPTTHLDTTKKERAGEVEMSRRRQHGLSLSPDGGSWWRDLHSLSIGVDVVTTEQGQRITEGGGGGGGTVGHAT